MLLHRLPILLAALKLLLLHLPWQLLLLCHLMLPTLQNCTLSTTATSPTQRRPHPDAATTPTPIPPAATCCVMVISAR